MAVTANEPAPYAPAAAVLEIIKRHRDRGLAGTVTPDVLARHGISDSLVPRTIQTLRGLDLIDDEGRPTETFEGLRLAPEAQYTERLTQWLNSAYADVLSFIDPATANETELRDAFRSYKPTGQQARMISLFTGLYVAAGVRADRGNAPRSVRKAKSPPSNGGAGRRSNQPLAPAPEAPKPQGQVVPPSGTEPMSSVSMRALEYELVDLLKHEDIADTQREAVWTLVQYLASRKRGAT